MTNPGFGLPLNKIYKNNFLFFLNYKNESTPELQQKSRYYPKVQLQKNQGTPRICKINVPVFNNTACNRVKQRKEEVWFFFQKIKVLDKTLEYRCTQKWTNFTCMLGGVIELIQSISPA